MRIIAGLLFTLLGFAYIGSSAQCIVINEFLIDGPGGCDGGCSPNTEEWVELYNTCNTPVDISCYVMGDGDWSVRIPSGTVIPPFGFYTIGSSNSGIPLNLNLGTCGCTSGGGQVGIFTNGSEQIILFDNAGVVQDAVIWGGGQLPANVNNSAGGCSDVNYSATLANTSFETVPLNGSDGGCSYARSCDGSSTWVLRCGGEISAQATNGEAPLVDFDASSSNICIGECIDFSDLTQGDILTWAWTFTGSSTSTSSDENPSNICYPTTGNFDVTLSVTSTCGASTFTANNFIIVNPAVTPQITADVTSICDGEIATLQTNAAGDLQWYNGLNPINGATSSTLEVAAGGTYYVQAGNGSCSSLSNEIVVISSPIEPIVISNNASTNLCNGETATLSVANIASYTSFQWFDSNGEIVGETSSSLIVDLSGSFYCIGYLGNCSAQSETINVSVVTLTAPTLTLNGPGSICDGETTAITISPAVGYDSIQWFNTPNLLAGESENIITISSAGFYYAQVSSNGCVINSNELEISVTPFSSPIITSPAIDPCVDMQVELSVSSPQLFTGFQWYDASGQISGATANTYIAFTTGNYYCIAENLACSGSSNEIQVSLEALPSSQISPVGPIVLCPGEEVEASLSGSYTTFDWLKDGNFYSSSPTISITQSGDYQAVLYNSNGCSSTTNTLEVSVSPVPSLIISTLNNETQFCPGSSLALSASAGFEAYSWSLGNSNVGNSSSLEAIVEGVYTVVGTTIDSCEAEASIQITESTEPIVSITPNGNIETCALSQTLNATPGYIYQWFDGNGEILGQNNSTIYIEENGVYTVLATNALGCQSFSSDVSITFIEAPEFSVIVPDAACEGNIVQLMIAGDILDIVWNTGGTNTSLNISTSGTYTAQMVFDNGCEATTSIDYEFLPIPSLNYDIVEEANCFSPALIDLEYVGDLSWSSNSVTANSDSTTLSVSILSSLNLPLSVSLGECSISENIYLAVDCASLFIPNVFTPNQDGVNDFFQVVGEGIGEFELIIFNRWGKIVFQTNDPSARWDGGYDEYYVPDGVYYYIVKALDFNGLPIAEDVEMTGTITILR